MARTLSRQELLAMTTFTPNTKTGETFFSDTTGEDFSTGNVNSEPQGPIGLCPTTYDVLLHFPDSIEVGTK